MTNDLGADGSSPRPLLVGGCFLALTVTLGAACSSDSGDKPWVDGSMTGGESGEGSGGRSGGEAGADGSGGRGGDAASGGGSQMSCEAVDCVRGECSVETGVAACECEEGFSGWGCPDVNECASPATCETGRCVNTFGGFVCQCGVGERAQGGSCVDIDECAKDICAPGAICEDLIMGYRCACGAGTFGNGWDCSATDSCATDPCGEAGTCVVTSAGARCQCEPGTSGHDDCVTPCATLEIPDFALRTAISDAVGKYIQDIDPAVDLALLTTLDASDLPVLSLDGLECWPNLERLYLNRTALGQGEDTTPLEALGKLNRLVELHLGCMEIPDLEALRAHPTLTTLNFDWSNCETQPSGLVDFEALATLKRLENLDLSGHVGVDLEALAELKGLRRLLLNNAGLTSLSPLGDLPLLENLYAAQNSVDDGAPLIGLETLKELNLSDNELEDLSWVVGLPGLEVLVAGQNFIAALPDWASNLRLYRLELPDNDIEELRPLLAAPALSVLDLTDNAVRSLDSFVESGFRGSISASGNAFDCATEQSTFSQLVRQGVRLTTDCTP